MNSFTEGNGKIFKFSGYDCTNFSVFVFFLFWLRSFHLSRWFPSSFVRVIVNDFSISWCLWFFLCHNNRENCWLLKRKQSLNFRISIVAREGAIITLFLSRLGDERLACSSEVKDKQRSNKFWERSPTESEKEGDELDSSDKKRFGYEIISFEFKVGNDYQSFGALNQLGILR